jgi:purine-binding chemotaxis protein CheW
VNTTTTPKPTDKTAACSERGGKYLTFSLAAEAYGLEILKVQEIIGMMNVTRVPRTPEFIRGVINLRGKVIPVIDLRKKLQFEGKSDTERTCIIVVQVQSTDSAVTMGSIVDSVSDVTYIAAEQIESAPEFGSSVSTEFILGMGKVGQKVIILLDADRILSQPELQKATATVAA